MDAAVTIEADRELDASGMNCPLPVLKTRKAINDMGAGEVLRMISTDAGSLKDIEAFCRQTGHELITSNDVDGAYIFFIRKH